MPQLAPVNLLITTGEPAGIGPEVSLSAALAFLAEQENASVMDVAERCGYESAAAFSKADPLSTLSSANSPSARFKAKTRATT